MNTFFALSIEAVANIILLFAFAAAVRFLSALKIMRDRKLIAHAFGFALIYPFMWSFQITLFWLIVTIFVINWNGVAEYIQHKLIWVTRFSKHVCTMACFIVLFLVSRRVLYPGDHPWNIFY